MISKIHFIGMAVFFAALLLSMSAFSDTGMAVIKGTRPGSSISGVAIFKDTEEGLSIRVEVENVPPGKHGFHIHEFGTITRSGKDAGGHFNPDNKPHGFVPRDGITNVHPGDLGNVEVGPDGTGMLQLVIGGLTLSNDRYSIGGRSVILHEKEDDFGQPTGNAGSRIGAGMIVITGN